MNIINTNNQYKNDIFNKLAFPFQKKAKILDLGCGDGGDAKIFINEFELETYGSDVYKHQNIEKINGLKFTECGIYDLSYENEFFDYVWLHDVLHHIDEPLQRESMHIAGLREAARVLKKGGVLLIVEGNRYNPLFYPHMVKALGHDHFKQKYFKHLLTTVCPGVEFAHFEAHFYPQNYLKFWKVYEQIMEKFCPKKFLAYNIALWRKNS